LKRYAGVWSLWALGVGAVISGHYSGWNLGIASGGWGGMLAQGGGSIVCTSSISAVAATPMETAYNTSKGACHMFARSIAVEYRDKGIRCNAVCPGFVKTPHGLREVAELTKLGVDASEEALAVQQGRLCEPEEVARAALFLASDEASFVNGAHLFVDNCFTAV
jgi:NAD(P)-dependent dehydrogenase (short-subunit alcohol dehydrogenase family)